MATSSVNLTVPKQEVNVPGLSDETTVNVHGKFVASISGDPVHVYAISAGIPPAAAECAQIEADDGSEGAVLAFYLDGMVRSDIFDVAGGLHVEDLLWLHELHELSHWADGGPCGDEEHSLAWNERLLQEIRWLSES